MAHIFLKNQKVKFTLGRNKKTTLTGKIVSTSRKCAFIKVERVSGKFANQNQRNTLCIGKDNLMK